MADERLERELELARRAAPAFGRARQQRVIWGAIHRSQRARARVRRLAPLAAALCLAGVVLGAYLWMRTGARRSVATVAADERWLLRDGSRITMETPDTRITKQRESLTEMSFQLAAGAARFEVARRPERVFRVEAGLVRVEVLGTSFRVERRHDQALVSVERGRVRVTWPGASRDLFAGQSGSFPPEEAAESLAASSASRAVPSSLAAIPSALSISPTALPAPVPDASARLERRTVASEPPSEIASAEALFGAADRARAEGRTLDATRALRELTRRYPRDAHAPLAAFTLGRLLLDNLHQASDAARAFAQARALAGGNGALAEDALAREAEAWQVAGNAREAARCAELYRARYPRGAHAKQLPRSGEPAVAP